MAACIFLTEITFNNFTFYLLQRIVTSENRNNFYAYSVFMNQMIFMRGFVNAATTIIIILFAYIIVKVQIFFESFNKLFI